MSVRVRFAPSPTGYLHIGGARTALYNWLFARQKGGTFILRLEDTDAERNTPGAVQAIYDGLRWLGIDPDEGPEQGGPAGPYVQSERQDLYVAWGRRIRETGAAYPCFCTQERLRELRAAQEQARASIGYDRRCRGIPESEASRRIEAGEEHTWRLKVPAGDSVVLQDLVRGRVEVKLADIEDIILVRQNGVPIYNFAVVIDDHLMGITHVLRGEDHLTNTFKQILIFRAFGWDIPAYGHLPIILGPVGEGKLSKRKHPEAALEHFRRRGYPPEAVVNWLALIGWSFDDHTVIMSRRELIERFSVERVNPSAARLPLDKLDWMAGDYIRRMTVEEVEAAVRPFLLEAGLVAPERLDAEAPRIRRLVAAVKDRLRCMAQITDLGAFAFAPVRTFDEKASKNLRKRPDTPLILRRFADDLAEAPFQDPAALEASARAFAGGAGLPFGDLVHPVRAAWTGLSTGPGLFECGLILGRDEAVARLRTTADMLEAGPPAG